MIRVQKTIPPVATIISLSALMHGLLGMIFKEKYISKLSYEIKKYFSVKHVFLVSSGKAALCLILQALKENDNRNEVIVPAYTCYSVPSAVITAGLSVKLCDIVEDTFDYDLAALKKSVNEKTLCVLTSNLFGVPSNIDEIRVICEEHKTYVVEDAAQAMGGVYDNQKIGTIGDVGFYSLGRGKNITSGSGGIIVTNTDVLAEKIANKYSYLKYPNIIDDAMDYFKLILMSIFIRPWLYWIPSSLPALKLGETFFFIGFPSFKLSGIKAGCLYGWSKNLDKMNSIRMKNVKYISKQFSLSSPLLRIPILLKDKEARDRIYSISEKNGYGLSKMYPLSINKIEDIKDQFKNESFPVAEDVAERLIAAPLHQYLSDFDKHKIASMLNREMFSQI